MYQWVGADLNIRTSGYEFYVPHEYLIKPQYPNLYALYFPSTLGGTMFIHFTSL